MRIGVGLSIPELATRGGRVFSPLSLFTSGVQGAWYDPSDINSYMSGLGPELVTNGDFASGTTGWSVYSGLAPDTFEVVGGELHIANDGSTRGLSGTASAAGPSVVAGATYKVTFTLRVVTASGNASVQLNQNYFGTSRLSIIGNIASALGVGTHEITRYYTATNTELLTFSVDSGVSAVSDLYFDNISVKQVTSIGNATLFQDSAGTTPVTAVEQPVGLMLDKSQGLVLGSELVTNGGPFSNTTGWVAQASTLSAVSNNLVITATGAAAKARWTFTSVVGRTYKYSVELISTTMTGSLFIGVANAATFGTEILSRNIGTTVGTYTGYFTATTTTTSIHVGASSSSLSGETATWNNISVKEIAGNHASQATTASRPVLRARYNQLTYSEALSNAAWNIKTNLSIASGATDPDGGSTAFTVTATAANGRLLQSTAVAVNVNHTASVWLRRKTGTGTITWEAVDVGVGPTITLTSSWQRFTYAASPASTTFYYGFRINTSGDEIEVWHPDLRQTGLISSAIPNYQRIAAATDYATAGFAPYLAFDGVDDFLSAAYVQSAYPLTITAGVNNDTSPSSNLGIASVNQSDSSYKQLRDDSAGQTSSMDRNAAQNVTPTITVTGNKFCLAQLETSLLTHQVNGGTTTTLANANAFGTSVSIFLGKTRPAGLFSPARDYGVVITNTVLSAAEKDSLKNWMASKMGVTL